MKTFDCPHLATNICDSLKLACTLLIDLILKENLVRATLVDKVDWMREVNSFKNLLETQWIEDLSLSDDIDLSENIYKKPSLTQIPIPSKQEFSKPIKVQIPYSLLHLAVHLKHFHEEVLKIAFQCQQELFTDDKNNDAYRLLVQSSLALLYTSNMRNVEDIQYITIKHYLNDEGVTDFENYISNVERLLSTKHKRILISKEEDEKVLILIPYIIECFISVLLTHRGKYMDEDNKYIFAVPGSDTKWGESEVALRNLCQIIKLEEESIGSNRFRKYTAIIMGILNLSQVELQQLDHYMRCVLESEYNFFELPLDACQLAKFARLLGMMEEGSILSKYKRKCLAEIDIDPNNEFPSLDVEGQMEDITINHVEYVDVEDKCTDKNYQQCLDNVNETVESSIPDEKHSPTRNDYENNQSLQNNKTDSSTVLETLCDKPARDELQKTSSDTGNKRGWKNEEIALIEKEYSYFIEYGVYPSGKQMNTFLMENKMTKTVPILRSKIQHLIRMRNK
ncbi:hypothetical protein WA026_004176 [Henosepilachna vigintioctopunctata]|uniref:Uncharacterized protein n=1 Tax=Henosepilachna vigintioctopunctata TaxID=420089 RepID=A0AAW1U9J2_9CUCU